MFRVREQLGFSDKLLAECGRDRITVAMLDTGVARHPDFDDRLFLFRDFVNGRKDFYDDSGHGTHVAGCICGSGRASMGRYRGIAPGCRLIVGKVLDYRGDGMLQSMTRALEWILNNQEEFQIRILNISIGMGEASDGERMRELLSLVDEVWNRGIIVVCAAGNGGPGAMTISPIGARKKVITVSCNEDGYFGEREDLCEEYSSRGPSPYDMRKPDIVAPGTDIISCNAFFEKRGFRYRNAYTKKSGTSMATPIVSGALALLLQKYPKITNEQAKHKLIMTARDLNEPWSKQGAGMIEINSLLT